MDDGRELDSIDIDLKLSIIKPFHTKWMMEVYNEMTSAERKEVCLKGWEVFRIKGAVELGVTKLPNLDLFDDINLMLEEDCNDTPVIDSSAILRAVPHIPSDHEIESGHDDDGDDEEWIDEQNERNVVVKITTFRQIHFYLSFDVSSATALIVKKLLKLIFYKYFYKKLVFT